MIKIYTSYFYQVRNMRPGDLAFSTALGDPAWFHDFTGDKQYKFIDKRGVLNGLRAEPFCPRLDLRPEDECRGRTGCPHLETNLPWYCNFLLEYYDHLKTLDPENIEERFLKVGESWQEFNNKEMDITYILLVHEAPTNPCSERVMLQRWLSEKGFGGEEWNKNI